MPKTHSSVYLCLLLASLPVLAQDASQCSQSCETDKLQCRTEADSREFTERYPPLPDTTEMLDRKRDMRSVLDDKQRSTDAVKNYKFERYEQCTKFYMACLNNCRTDAQPGPNNPGNTGTLPQ